MACIQVYETAMFTSENMLLCAPTGAGKTNCAMLCILHEVGMHLRDDGTVDTSAFKIVYVAPMKVGAVLPWDAISHKSSTWFTLFKASNLGNFDPIFAPALSISCANLSVL